jgi:isoleucyl-tRNA synthetase
LKWFAPIFVFTAEEIYNLIKKDDKSIHEHTFVKLPEKWENSKLNEKWKSLYKIKQEANIAIEQKRTNKEIGSSLEAEIEISINKSDFELMEGLDLAEYFITSKATINENDKNIDTKIIVKKSLGTKCSRCWKVVENKCARCETVTKEKLN